MHGRTTLKWMAGSFGLALMIACIALWLGPAGDRIGTALRATARCSFILFWLASSGGALAVLFGSRFQLLARRARDFGLAFAAAHLVHLALVAMLYHVAVDAPVSGKFLIFFGVGVVFTYVLAISSIERVAAALPPGTWRILRRLGVEYIAVAFFVDFAKNPLQAGFGHLIAYVPFQILAAAGPMLRLAAALRRYTQTRAATI